MQADKRGFCRGRFANRPCEGGENADKSVPTGLLQVPAIFVNLWFREEEWIPIFMGMTERAHRHVPLQEISVNLRIRDHHPRASRNGR